MNNNQLTTYEANYITDSGDKLELNLPIVRNVLAAGENITNIELFSFIKLCEYQKLNPFIKEAYLIKYGKNAQMVVGIDVFTNRLNEHPFCEGWKAGLIVEKNGAIEKKEGTFYLKNNEKIVGAWFDVIRKGWKEKFPWTITFDEYYRTHYNKDAKKWEGMGQWKTMPAVMIVKCAITSGCRKAFPKAFSGMYSAEEMGVQTIEDENVININTVVDADSEVVETEYISENQKKQLKDATKSIVVDIDTDKLISFVLDGLKKFYALDKKVTFETIPASKFDLLLKKINDFVIAKEKQAGKNEALPEKQKEAIPKNVNMDELPVTEMNYAKPANTKKTNTDTKTKTNTKTKTKDNKNNEK